MFLEIVISKNKPTSTWRWSVSSLLELWQDRDRLQVGRHIHMFGPKKIKNNLTKPKAIIIKINIYFPKVFCSIFVVFCFTPFFFSGKNPCIFHGYIRFSVGSPSTSRTRILVASLMTSPFLMYLGELFGRFLWLIDGRQVWANIDLMCETYHEVKSTEGGSCSS